MENQEIENKNSVLGQETEERQEQVDTEPQGETENQNTEQEQVDTNNPETENQETTFTQEQVNDIVRERLERNRNSIYSRYGVQGKDELDALVGKAQSYDVMNEQYNSMTEELNAIKQENAFLKNDVNLEKKDDILAYFKGKGIELNADTLKQELETHKEWENVNKNTTTIEALSSEESHNTELSDKEKVLRMFGY